MIPSFDSRLRPPPNPSATSARPSSCSAPVMMALPPSASAAAAKSGTPMIRRPRHSNPTTAPISAPTTGNIRCARTKFWGIAPSGCGIGSRGRLEELAIWLAQWQGREMPRLERVTIAVFVGNHGVAARGVSAYPQAVTAQMVANFAAGGAAINQIAKAASAELRVVPIELERPTRDFTEAAAMSTDEYIAAVDAGYRTVPEDC